MMTIARGVAAAASAALALVLSGCGVDGDAVPEATVVDAAGGGGLDDIASSNADMCWQFSDTLTLIGNMKFANDEGRLVGNEWDGIVRLAMRQLARIPVDQSSDVGEAIADLQQHLPLGHAGDMRSGPALDDPVWVDGTDAIRRACSDAVPEWGIEGWVGG